MRPHLANAALSLLFFIFSTPSVAVYEPNHGGIPSDTPSSNLRRMNKYIGIPDTSLTMLGAMSRLSQKRDANTLFSILKRNWNEMSDSAPVLLPRQATTPTSSTAPAVSSGAAADTAGSFDTATWDAQVNAACMPAIMSLTKNVTLVTDPAGVAVCYNIPYYNMTTGIFASDIRLYKITTGTPEWEAIEGAGQLSLGVVYNNITNLQLATAPTTTTTTTTTSRKKRCIGCDGDVEKRQATTSGLPKLLETMNFIGQVDANILANMTMAMDPFIMQLVLIPNLTLNGKSATTGLAMNASVADAQVNYVAGAFTNITAPPAPPPAKFVLPGTKISIVPAGLYLYSAWMGLFVLIVGFGTWERYQFRMSFRKKRSLRNGKTGFGKI